MNPLMWSLGRLLHPPSITVCTSTSQPLRLKLESVGSITHVRFCRSLSDLEPEEEFRHTTRDVLSSPGCHTASGFVAAMERIYPSYLGGSIGSLPTTLADFVQSNPDFIHCLEALLADFRHQEDEMDIIEQQMTSQEIIDLLGLSRPCFSSIAGFSRMEWAMTRGNMCYMHACGDYSLPWLLTKLPIPCSAAWEACGPCRGLQGPRSPIFSYFTKWCIGVGIVVSQNEIIGRMFSGTPACECRMLVDVGI